MAIEKYENLRLPDYEWHLLRENSQAHLQSRWDLLFSFFLELASYMQYMYAVHTTSHGRMSSHIIEGGFETKGWRSGLRDVTYNRM